MSDYDRIAAAIAFITTHADRQPGLDEIAAHAHLSPYHFQRLFRRWAGVTPKRFLQVLTVERAKSLLHRSRPLLEVADAVGLSSGSRLYDHFIQLEGMTPGEFRSGGQGLSIAFGVHDSPFGEAFIAATPRGVCALSFLSDPGDRAPLHALSGTWPHADIREDRQRTGELARAIFGTAVPHAPLSLHVRGTNFQVKVWQALLQIPPGSVVSYGDVAAAIGRPRAARAVGLAVGANPVAFVIPCHRVIRQSGGLGGYRWGETRKHAIHAWETARSEDVEPPV